MKKAVLLIVAVMVLLLPVTAFAAGNSTVTSYDVDITVNENNTYDVVENLVQAYVAGTNTHGMYKVINLRPTVTMEHEGQVLSKEYKVIVNHVSVDNEYETSVEDGRYVIRIGDPDVYVDGQTIPYRIAYTYDAGDDGFSDFDMFYYGIIGNTWEVPIENVTFKITMPKEFDASMLGFSVGATGAQGYNPETLQYEVQGNVITGSFKGVLSPGEGIWARVELPAGYFVGARTPQSGLAGFVITCGVVTGLALILFLLFRRKGKPVVTVEFYPPEGMTSADVGFIVDGIVEDKDVVSLLIYWADKGCMEIHEGETKQEMIFKKVKELPETANEYEKLMFSKLFGVGNAVSTTMLQYKFYDTVSATKTRIKTKFELAANRVFKQSSLVLQDLACILAAFPVAAMAALALYADTYELMMTILAGAFMFFCTYALAKMFVKLVNRWQSEKRSSKTGVFLLWLILTAVLYAVVMLLCYEAFGKWVWVAPLCALLITLMAPAFRKRTEQGNAWFGRILGLKNFIATVEAEKLKMMVEEDPAYFYNILPYAYVLGISDKWAKRFESITIEPPSWYYGGGWETFSTIYFTSALMGTMARTQAIMATRPSSSGGSNFGGGGFSGGGFSGGGFGGGGGGTW